MQKLTKGEILMVNIGSLTTGGRVTAVKADLAKISLTSPVCTEVCVDFYTLSPPAKRKDCVKSSCGAALAVDWLGRDPKGCCAGAEVVVGTVHCYS